MLSIYGGSSYAGGIYIIRHQPIYLFCNMFSLIHPMCGISRRRAENFLGRLDTERGFGATLQKEEISNRAARSELYFRPSWNHEFRARFPAQ